MVLADTPVWIDHLRGHNNGLRESLQDGSVLMHPFVIGELACGNLQDRAVIMRHLAALPRAARATDEEVIYFIESRNLWGRGIGWVDAHLLSAALLSQCGFWTTDKRLHRVAVDSGLESLGHG